MSFIKVNDSNIYYELSGQGKYTLDLIHGFVSSKRWWEPMFPLLTQEFQVLRFDLPGCGQSESTSEAITVH